MLEGGVGIAAADLDVDRRGCAEIQDLADDVGRQEREGEARKALGQPASQLGHVVGGRPVIGSELDLNLAVLAADRAGVVVGHVDAAHWKADILDQRLDLARRDDAADLLLDLGETGGSLLDARADRSTNMHQDAAGIDLWKEIAAERGCQEERSRDEAQEACDEKPCDGEARARAGCGSCHERWRSPPRSRAGTSATDCASAAARHGRARHAASGDTWPWSAPACATGSTTTPWRT